MYNVAVPACMWLEPSIVGEKGTAKKRGNEKMSPARNGSGLLICLETIVAQYIETKVISRGILYTTLYIICLKRLLLVVE